MPTMGFFLFLLANGTLFIRPREAWGVQLENVIILTDRDIDRVTGAKKVGDRLQGTGLFGDPNDMCVMLASLVPLVLYFLTDKKAALKLLGVASAIVFAYAIVLTRSR